MVEVGASLWDNRIEIGNDVGHCSGVEVRKYRAGHCQMSCSYDSALRFRNLDEIMILSSPKMPDLL
jgi:hypothetical protein